MKKWFPYILIVILALSIFFIRKYTRKSGPTPTITNNNRKDPAFIDRDRGFDRRISFIEYSNHAKCRMNCREITQAEVEEIMKDGKINYNKSDLKNVKCPRYALEGVTRDSQRVRIVFAQCNESTVVVTVIDLETEFQCNCPGDDDKFKNRN